MLCRVGRWGELREPMMPPEKVGLLGMCTSFFIVGMQGLPKHNSDLSLPQLLIYRKPGKWVKSPETTHCMPRGACLVDGCRLLSLVVSPFKWNSHSPQSPSPLPHGLDPEISYSPSMSQLQCFLPALTKTDLTGVSLALLPHPCIPWHLKHSLTDAYLWVWTPV